MVEIQIRILLSQSQSSPIYLNLTQSNKSIYTGPLSPDITIFIPDMLTELQLSLEVSSIVSSITFFLLPLLLSPNYNLNLQQDPVSLLYSAIEQDIQPHLIFEFSRKSEIDLSNFNSSEPEEKNLGLDQCLGIDLNEKRLGTEKYLESLVVGLNGKLVQKEVRRICQGNGERLLDNPQQAIGKVTEWVDSTKPQENSSPEKPIQESHSIHQSSNNPLQELIKFHECTIVQLKKENQLLSADLSKEKDQNLVLTSSLSKCQSKILRLKNRLIEFQALNASTQTLNQQIDRLKKELKDQEQANSNLKAKLESCISDFQSSIESFKSQQLSSDQLNSSLTDSLNSKDLEILQLKDLNSALNIKISQLSADVQYYSSQSQITEKFSQLLGNHLCADDKNPSSNQELSITSIMNNKEKIDEQAEQMKILIEKLKNTQKKLEETEDNNKNQEDIIKLLMAKSKIEETNEIINKSPQFIGEFSRISDELGEIYEVGNEFELKFYQMAMGYLKRINKLSEVNLEFHRLFEKYFKLMYDKDCQIYMLRHIARDAQLQRQIYVPVKSDPIDVCVAEFVNNRKIPLAIPLIREDQGVYNFYTRTIKVKVENNRVIVRLGGGFQGIEDFISQNTQIELDKLEERRKFGCAEAVKKLIDSDFQILGLPPAIDHLTPPIASNETSFSSNPNNSILFESTPQKKRGSVIAKEIPKPQFLKKKTLT